MDNQLAYSTDDPYYSSSGLVPNLSRMATTKKNSDPVWAKVATLESSIAAVEREQEIVEAAMLRSHESSSPLSLPGRIRGLLVGTATDDRQGRNLEDDLKWLRKKEEQLRKEKLLLMQNEVFASAHDLLPDPQLNEVGEQQDRQMCDDMSPVIRKASYFSSPRSSSAAAAAFAAYSAALTAESAASSDSPLVPAAKTRFPRRWQQQHTSEPRRIGEPDANVARSKSFVFRRHSSARSASSTTSPKRVGNYFSSLRGFGRASSSKPAAYSGWWNKGVGSDPGTESMDVEEGGSLREEPSSWSNTGFDGRNPFLQRSTARRQNKNNSNGGASRPGEVGRKDVATSVGARLGAPRKKSTWRRIFGLEDKNPEGIASEPSALVVWGASPSDYVSNRSSDDETSETSSSSYQNKVVVAPKGPVMMRGYVHPVAHSYTGGTRQSSLRQATPPRGKAFADTVPASGRKMTEAGLRRFHTPPVSPNRKVRFKIPTSPSDPYYSPPPSVSVSPVEISDAMEQSAPAMIELQRERGRTAVNIMTEGSSQESQSLFHSSTEDLLGPSLLVAPSLGVGRAKGDETASKRTQKLLMLPDRYSRGDGSLNVQRTVLDIDYDKGDDVCSLFTETGGTRRVEEVVPPTTVSRPVVRTKKSLFEPIPSRRSIFPRSRDRRSDVTGYPSHKSRIDATSPRRSTMKDDTAAVPPAPTPRVLTPRGADIGRDTLENISGLLASTFASMDAETSPQRNCERAAEVVAKLTAAAMPSVAGADSEAPPLPPSAWVTRYVDKSTNYGLGFLLSDGTVGVRFRDASKIALEATGGAFDYIKRPRRKPRARVRTEEGLAETRDLMDGWRAPRSRQTLHDYSPDLKKKVKLLKYFRKHLRMLGGENGDDDLDDGEGSPATLPSLSGEERHGPTEQVIAVPLTVVEKWRRTRHSCLFFLSTLTVQVVFADTTQILLSDGARVVTFVDKARDRHTLTLHRVLQDQRMEIVKRLRYSKDLIQQLLTRDEHSMMSARNRIRTKTSPMEIKAAEYETAVDKGAAAEVDLDGNVITLDESSLRE